MKSPLRLWAFSCSPSSAHTCIGIPSPFSTSISLRSLSSIFPFCAVLSFACSLHSASLPTFDASCSPFHYPQTVFCSIRVSQSAVIVFIEVFQPDSSTLRLSHSSISSLFHIPCSSSYTWSECHLHLPLSPLSLSCAVVLARRFLLSICCLDP